MPWLTKSRFLSGLQCQKRLWFEVHQPLKEVAEPGPAILQGRSFDAAVQGIYPGVVVSRGEGMPAAITETTRLLALGAAAPTIMYQPTFRAGDLAFIADMLRRTDDGFELMEVKATTEVKERHIPDAAFQALVLKNAGIPLRRVLVGHVNNQFALKQKGQYEGLLTETDVTNEVNAYLPTAVAQAADFQRVMTDPKAPKVEVGNHCSTPYECPFMGRCHAHLPEGPEYPVESLPRGGKMMQALIDEGYVDLREVPNERLTNEMHRRILEATVSGVPYFNPTATAELRNLPSPFAYLDFETIGFAVPEIIGTRPYEQLPFQWSVHVETSATGIRHAEYLAIESFGDFDDLAERLIAAIPPEGPIFAYNASFEQGILERLTELSPMHAQTLLDMVRRLVDLLPIARQAYYHRDMHGSWSIKNVIPTIDASLDYGMRGEVQEGMAAQAAFLELRSADIHLKRAAELRAALLDYCQHDTWVMIVLRRFLCGETLGLGS
jgi:hypothetical protein